MALLATVPAFAASPIEEKQAEAQQVYAQVLQLDSNLDRANELVNFANFKLAVVKQQIVVNRHELRIAKHNLSRSRHAIAQRLITLYTTPPSSTMEVILGARSLDEVLTRFDTESRVSSTDTEVLNEVVTYKGAVNRHRRVLEHKRAEVRRLVAARKAQQQSIRIQLVERAQLLNSIQGEIARLQAEERARQLQMARLAQARLEQAQLDQQSARMSASATAEPVVGATALTPEGASVVPSSRYGGAVGVAMSEVGTPYVWAGASPGGFDCSGLVVYSYAQEGVSLPHSSYALWNEGVPVSQDQLQPGDLVFFNGLGHVGIYVGDDEFVHAPHTGTVVSVSSLSSYGGGFVGARRIP